MSKYIYVERDRERGTERGREIEMETVREKVSTC